MATVAIAVPARPTSGSGNDVTANRWAELLRDLGHVVEVVKIVEPADSIETWQPDSVVAPVLHQADTLIALHARRSSAVSHWWSTRYPRRRLIVALTGTDLYQDMPADPVPMQTAERANALIVLQRAALDRLDLIRPSTHGQPGWRQKTTVVPQSVDSARLFPRSPVAEEFRVVVLAHLRPVKDPLLAARAARLLPAESRVAVHLAGKAFSGEWAQAAEAEAKSNRRFLWHGEVQPPEAMRLVASAHVLACTSTSEGGANVVTEAIATGVPVIGTRIDGTTGIVGDDYPGLFPVGDAEALARLLTDLESDSPTLAELQRRTDQLASVVDPATEQAHLARLIAMLD